MLLKIYPDTEMTLEAFPAGLCGCAAESDTCAVGGHRQSSPHVNGNAVLWVLWVLSGNVGGWLDPRGFIPQGQSMPGCASNLWGGLMILNDPEKGTREVAEFL